MSSMPTFSFAFGANNGYFISGPQGRSQGRGIPEFQRSMHQMNSRLLFYPQTSHGVDDTYVTVNARGQAWFRLNGKYPTLEQALRTRTASIELVAISPYQAGVFLIIYKNGGGYLGNLPMAYRDEVIEFVCEGQLPFLQQAQRQQAQTNDFLLNLLFR